MNIFLHELKSYRKSTFIWMGSLSLLVIFMMSLYPAFSNDVENFKKLLEGYPKEVLKALGASGDIFSLLGFYSFIFLYVLLCGCVQAMSLGVSIISKESSQKTSDFLLTKPISRVQVITAKLLAALVSLILTNIVYIAAALIMAGIVKTDDFNVRIFVMISAVLFLVQLVFMSLGFAVGAAASKIKSVTSVSLSTVFGLFIINMLGSIIGEEIMRYITPFKYYDFQYIIKNGAYETRFVILEMVVVCAAIGITYWIYSKKDIHTV